MTLLAGTWPDRSNRCVAPAKTHRKSYIPRLLTAMARSDLVCARAVDMLDVSLAEVCRAGDPGGPPAAPKARAHKHFFGTCVCRVDSAWIGARAWAGGGAHVAALEGSRVAVYESKTYFTPSRGVVPPGAVVGLVASATRQGFRSERGDSKNQLNAAGIK